MSITVGLRKAGPYTGDGSTRQYSFQFKVFAAQDIVVAVADAQGVETQLAYNVDYNVSLNSDQEQNPGGRIILTTPLTDGNKLAIVSNMPIQQPTVFTNSGGFYPETLNASLDRLTIYAKQHEEKLKRAYIAAVNSDAETVDFPSPSANTFLQWDADGKLSNFDLDAKFLELANLPGGLQEWAFDKKFYDVREKINDNMNNTKLVIGTQLNETKLEINNRINQTQLEINNQLTQTKQSFTSEIDNTKIDKTAISDAINSSSSETVASSKAVKIAYDAAQESDNTKVNKTSISDAINSNSSQTVASSKAAKIAYDKGVEALNHASRAIVSTSHTRIINGNSSTGGGNTQNINVTGEVLVFPDGRVEQYLKLHNFQMQWFQYDANYSYTIPVDLWTAMPNQTLWVDAMVMGGEGATHKAGAGQWARPILKSKSTQSIELVTLFMFASYHNLVDLIIKVEGY